MKTVVGLFDNFDDAQNVVRALRDGGFSSENISLVAHDADKKYSRYLGSDMEEDQTDVKEGTAAGAGIGAALGGLGGLLVGLGALAIPGIGPVLAAGPLVSALAGAGIGAVAGGLVGALVDMGIPEEHAQYYAEGVRRGGTLVTVRADDQMADRAVDIMNRFNPVDVKDRSQTWDRSTDTMTDRDTMATPLTPMTTDQTDYSRTEMRRERDEIPVTGESDVTLPVIEEDIEIGKRSVERGGVRIEKHTEETPVEEDIRLRRENINVDRRPVDRPASDKDFDSFKDETIELRETHEEPIVKKTSRVVEEVHVNKDVEEVDETIRDTVRRTDVDVQQISGDWNQYDNRFREHYKNTYSSMGHDYNYYQPAYRYGYELSSNPRYRDYDWTRLEPEARRDWERRGLAGAWDDVKDAVQHAWNSMRRM